MTKDLTKGSILPLLLLFTVPTLIGNIFQQLYSMVDTIIVGRFVGAEALAAVGTTGALSFLVLGFAMGCSGGFAVITSQYFGAKDYDNVRRSIATGTTLSLIIIVILTVLAVFITKPMLNVMNVPANIYDDAYTYIIIIFYGTAAVILYNYIAAIVRALGDAKTPLYFLIVSSVLNIILDYVSIVYWNWGVAGAAYATVLSQLVSGILCVMYSYRRIDVLHLRKEDWRFDANFAWKHLQIGLPMAVQFSIIAVGIVVLQSALNTYGSDVIAAFTAASKVETLVTLPYTSLGTTIATYCGQNLGAGKWHRLQKGVRLSIAVIAVFTVVAAAVCYFGGSFFVSLFLDEPTAEILGYAQTYLNTISIFFIFLGILFIMRSALQGMGDGFVPMLGGIAELIARWAIIVTLEPVLHYIGVCLASPGAWVLCCIPMLYKYFKMMHLHKDDIERDRLEEAAA